ncbi:MAG: hypothetical protein WDO17_20905 [Alphaproteobacteria bacterium]
MPHYSPELVASVLHDHEYTDKPLRQIAAEHGVSERDITRMRHAAGVASRRARVRALPETMREAHDITRRLMAAKPPAAAAERASVSATPSTLDGAAPSIVPPLPTDGEQGVRHLIARVVRLVDQELASLEKTRAELGLLARTATEAERCARIVASMIRSLREALRLHAGSASEQSPANHELPEDADDIRNELARRIEAFLEGRETEGSAERAPGAATVAR